MEMGSPEWIEASLAKLETLEQSRSKHESELETANDADSLRVHSQAIDDLDSEIKNLYAQLEAVAADEDEDEDETPATEPEPAPVAAAPPSEPEPMESPFGSPSAPSVAASPALGTESSSFNISTDPSYDYDPPAKSGAAKWVIAILLVGGAAGGGGYMYWQKQKAAEPAPQPVGPAKTITAGSVPEDTEGPRGAKGADVTKTPATDFSKGKRGGTRGGGGGGGGGSKSGGGSKKKGRDIKLVGGDDPI